MVSFASFSDILTHSWLSVTDLSVGLWLSGRTCRLSRWSFSEGTQYPSPPVYKVFQLFWWRETLAQALLKSSRSATTSAVKTYYKETQTSPLLGILPVWLVVQIQALLYQLLLPCIFWISILTTSRPVHLHLDSCNISLSGRHHPVSSFPKEGEANLLWPHTFSFESCHSATQSWLTLYCFPHYV